MQELLSPLCDVEEHAPPVWAHAMQRKSAAYVRDDCSRPLVRDEEAWSRRSGHELIDLHDGEAVVGGHDVSEGGKDVSVALMCELVGRAFVPHKAVGS